MTDETQKLSDRLTEAHVQIGRRDAMIEHLQEANLATIHKIGALHEKIGRMKGVNDQLLDALADLLEGMHSTSALGERAVLDMAMNEKDNGYEG